MGSGVEVEKVGGQCENGETISATSVCVSFRSVAVPT